MHFYMIGLVFSLFSIGAAIAEQPVYQKIRHDYDRLISSLDTELGGSFAWMEIDDSLWPDYLKRLFTKLCKQMKKINSDKGLNIWIGPENTNIGLKSKRSLADHSCDYAVDKLYLYFLYEFIYSAEDQWADAGSLDTLDEALAKSVLLSDNEQKEKTLIPKEAISEMQLAALHMCSGPESDSSLRYVLQRMGDFDIKYSERTAECDIDGRCVISQTFSNSKGAKQSFGKCCLLTYKTTAANSAFTATSGFYLDREGGTVYPQTVRTVTLAEFDSECKQIK